MRTVKRSGRDLLQKVIQLPCRLFNWQGIIEELTTKVNSFTFRTIEFLVVVFGFIIVVTTFFLEQSERRDQWLVNAWQIVDKRAPGASGKITAIHYLVRNSAPLIHLNFSRYRHGAPVYLEKLDIFDEDLDLGAWLPQSSFWGSIMDGSDLRKAQFRDGCFRETALTGSRLEGADFQIADLSGAILKQANVANAKFNGANLSGTDLRSAIGLTQQQLDSAFFCEQDGGPPLLSPELRSPQERACRKSQGCSWSRPANDVEIGGEGWKN